MQSRAKRQNYILCFGDKGRTEEDEDPKLKTTIKHVVTQKQQNLVSYKAPSTMYYSREKVEIIDKHYYWWC